jgi:hypothetical protein
VENRLVSRGDVRYTNDRDGNTLHEKDLRYEAVYEYNGHNRMVYSEVINHMDINRIASSIRQVLGYRH